MELVRALEESQKSRRGARRLLQQYGISDEATFTQPLAEMDKEVATRMIMNWLAFNSKEGHDYEIRIQVPERQTVYKTQIAIQNGATFIRKTQEAPELIGKALHCWPNGVSYNTLNHDEVQKSVTRADTVNNLTEDVLRAALAWKQEE